MSTYDKVKEFLNKYPSTVRWRVKKHAAIIDKHINPNEELLYAFVGQLNNIPWNMVETGVIAITTERLLIGRKYLWPGYKLISITPDLFNDLSVESQLFWGTIVIDTLKETTYVSDLDKKSLPEIETIITTFMEEKKKEYPNKLKEN